MDMTIDQQVALDEALVPHASRQRIGEKEILAFLRAFGHSREIKKITNEDFVYQVEHKDAKKSNQMYYPQFTKVIVNFFMTKDPSIQRRNKVNWHYVRDDQMFTKIKLVLRHQNTQQFGAILLVELTNEDIRNSAAYKEYYAIASGAYLPKQKQVSGRRTVVLTLQCLLQWLKKPDTDSYSQASESGAKEGTGLIPGVPDVPTYKSDEKISWKSSDKEDDDDVQQSEHDEDIDDQSDDESHDDQEDDDDQDDEDNDQTDSDNDGDDFVGRTFKDGGEDKDEEPSAGSNRGSKRKRSSKEESSKEATQKESKSTSSSKGASRSQPESSGKSAQVKEHGPRVDDLEEPFHQEFNTGNDDVSPARETVDDRPPQSWMTQLAQSSSTQSSFNKFLATPIDFSAFIMNQLKIYNPTQDVLTDPTYDLMKGTKYVTESLRAKLLTRSSNQPLKSYVAVASLLEFKLKKILMETIKENKSMHRSDIQKNLYNALIESYNSDKDIFDSYGDVVTLKRRRKSAQVKEHGPRVDDLEEPFHQEFNTGNDDVSPAREVTNVDDDCGINQALNLLIVNGIKQRLLTTDLLNHG
nr:hypothetical protein [Tanacetum cinerariifolium]